MRDTILQMQFDILYERGWRITERTPPKEWESVQVAEVIKTDDGIEQFLTYDGFFKDGCFNLCNADDTIARRNLPKEQFWCWRTNEIPKIGWMELAAVGIMERMGI